jgi:hypothetical protein
MAPTVLSIFVVGSGRRLPICGREHAQKLKAEITKTRGAGFWRRRTTTSQDLTLVVTFARYGNSGKKLLRMRREMP